MWFLSPIPIPPPERTEKRRVMLLHLVLDGIAWQVARYFVGFEGQGFEARYV